MPYVRMGRVRHSESVNFLWALRGLCLPPFTVSGRWGGRGGLKAACTLIGAGAVGALLALRYSPNSIFASGLSSTISAAAALPSKGAAPALDEEQLTVPGLQNSGNNCFLNVILQALASSKAFVSFTAACAEVTAKSQTKSLASYNDPVSMPLAVSVSSLMKELCELGGVDRTSSPRRVMLALRSYVKHFDLASQQDAAEALVHLASAIQEERDNYLQWLKPTFQTFATASLIHETQGLPNGGEKGFKHRRGGDKLLESWRGNLHWPLEGTLASSLTCQRCAHQYTTQIQFFNDISLSPLQDREGNIIQGCTLENCLEKFTGPEWIDNVKCIHCTHEAAAFSIYSVLQDSKARTTSPGRQCEESGNVLQSKLKMIEECSCDDGCECESLTRQQGGNWTDIHANASKQLRIGRSPEGLESMDDLVKKSTAFVSDNGVKVVCLQLQRVVMSDDGALKKLTGHVAFPKVLDLFPFTIAAESSMNDNSIIKAGQKESLLWKSLQQGNRSSSIGEDSGVSPKEASVLESELVYNFGVDSGTQASRSDTSETTAGFPEKEHRDICFTSSTEASTPSNASSTDSVSSITEEEPLKLSNNASGELLASEQTSSCPELPLEDFNSASPILSANAGSILTYSPLVSSISSQYVPRMFPRPLQAWSLISPYEGEKFSIASSGRLGSVSAMNSAPKSTNRSFIRTFKYSRRLLYELVSVVVHQGGPQSGHYIVYRKLIQRNSNDDEHELSESRSQEEEDTSVVGNFRRGKSRERKRCLDPAVTRTKPMALWFRVSDTYVEKVPEQEVLSARASLLFYEQLTPLQ